DYFLKHDYDSIEIANQELPATVEWLNSQLQWIIEERQALKQRIKKAEAQAYVDLASGELERRYPGVKRTETAIGRLVALDEEVNQLHARYARYCGWCRRLQNTSLAFQTKIDLVRSSEATKRRVFTAGPEHDDDLGRGDSDRDR